MTKPQWDRHTILAELRRRGMTLSGLAEIYGLSRGGTGNIWTRANEPTERAIADFLGEPVEALFPDRYPKRRNKILSSKYEGRKASQKDTAAPDRRAA
ncbi:helix-turn-helix domain-containing protein [Polymorphum gilvum]|uniref:Ner winged helix-turn-helix DNA-binding domain-containing protein n=1 Tax=Polymorphum gilvum (strain LMG 25793 / CGMCC 1.9160 / SL003B-26A1) TaxID=991905 RepID=F2J542_POLGS|nr:helix-turn-helix transcriptional regulator [Polymorphum gilvum]ADZ70084.1 hypothetical protein SL003B_1656 [Polymorphum gilvum SL003B-26A1]